MGFWDRLGDIADEWRDVRSGIAFEVAKVVTDDEDARKVARWFGNQTGTGERFGDVLGALDVPVSYGVKRPASTVNILLNEQGRQGRRPGGLYSPLFDLDRWRESWNASEVTSAGQSVTAAAGVGAMELGTDPTEFTPRERDLYFTKDTWGRITSGTIDTLLYYPDPTVGLLRAPGAISKARATIKAADKAAVFADDATAATLNLTRRQNRQRAIVDRLIKDTEGKTVSELATMNQFRQSADPGTLAYWFGKANEETDEAARLALKRDILGAAFGDADSFARIRTRSEALADDIENMTREIEEMEFARRFAANNEDFAFLVRDRNDPTRLRDLERQRDAIEDQIIQARRLIGSEASPGIAGGLRTLETGVHRRNYARVSAVIHDGRASTRPVHVITGRQIPGVFRTSDERSTDIFADVLAKAGGRGLLSQERRAALLDEYTVASAKERTALAIQAENEIFAAVGKKNGLGRNEMNAILRTTRGRKMAYINQLHSRLYGSADQSLYVPLVDEDGVVMALDKQMIEGLGDVPMLSSQLTDVVSMVDPALLDRLVGRATANGGGLAGFVKSVERGGATVWEMTEEGLSKFNRFWKFSALFRIAYPIRVQVDTQLRLLAALGAFRYVKYASGGGYNYLRSLKDAGFSAGSVQRRAITRRLGLSSLTPEEQEQFAELNRLIDFGEVDNLAALVKERDALAKRGGVELVRGRFGTYEATPYRNRAELERVWGDISPEQSVTTLLADGQAADLKMLRGTGQWDRIAGDSPQWMNNYLRVVNYQFRNDPVAMKVIAGETDDRIVTWLRTTPEGREYWRLHRKFVPSMEQRIERVRQNVDELLPIDSALRNTVTVRQLRPEDVDTFYPLPADRPPVRGEIMAEKQVQNFWKDMLEWWFREVGSMPELAMGRHPLYVARFRGHFAQKIEEAEALHGKLTLDQVNAIRQQASLLARRDISNTMYDITRQSNLAHFFRFVSPFFSAWEDTMHKWGKLIGADPGLLPRGYQVWGAPNAAGLVVDAEGNRVLKDGTVVDDDGNVIRKGNPFGMDQYMILPLGVGEGVGSLKIPKGSFNIVFQGDPWWAPGPGPIAAVPMNAVLSGALPEIVPGSETIKAWGPTQVESAWARWFLPYGAETSAKDVVLPAWVDRLWTLSFEGEGYDKVYNQLYAEARNKVRLGQLEPMTDREMFEYVNRQTRQWHWLKLLTAQASPVSVQPQSPLQFYIEEYRRYSREFGADADQKFREDYPEYYEMAIRLTKTNTGINATVPAWEAVQKYRPMLAKNPDFGWALAGAANIGGEFSQGVYNAQMVQEIGFGSRTKFRETLDPQEVARKSAVDQGWQVYRAGMTELRLALEDRGLYSFSQGGAEDLNALRNQFINDLKTENEAWAQDFLSGGEESVEKFLRWAQENPMKDPDLRNRGDFRALAEYMQGRQLIMQELQQRDKTIITHPDNADLKQAWDMFVAELIERDLGFEQIYQRVLERDNLVVMRES